MRLDLVARPECGQQEMLHGRPHALCVACDPSGPAVTPQAIARDDASPFLKAGCEAPHLGGPVRPDCWVLPLGPVSGWVGLKSWRDGLAVDFGATGHLIAFIGRQVGAGQWKPIHDLQLTT
ncbi:hypothetical protein NDU88_011355 [Pleurodeles waltl]|uniref:Uncharacterized protein n=1 Tax=Pleurodeles waltl TaxID=8319 RepID=A0AAV7S1Z7_PLEWA|nr:hypothetical protein NDU88_011355 [Pleurodeles waltl]